MANAAAISEISWHRFGLPVDRELSYKIQTVIDFDSAFPAAEKIPLQVEYDRKTGLPQPPAARRASTLTL